MKSNSRSSLFLALAIVAGSYVSRPTLDGKEIRIKRTKKLDTLLAKSRFAVVLFYRVDRDIKRDPAQYSQVKELEVMFRSLSKSPKFKEVNLPFLRVNVARGELQYSMQGYGVNKLPAFVLFKGGEQVKRDTGAPAVLEGFAARAQLEEFIEKYLQDEMEEVLEEQAEVRKRRLQEARIRYYERPYYPYYWYYPYWHYGHGYPYRRFGFGFYW